MQRQLFRFVFVWTGLLLLTFPFPRPYLPDIGKLLSPLTTAIADGVARSMHVHSHLPEIASDTRLMYLHIVLMFLLAMVISSLWAWRDRRAVAYPKLQYLLLVGARYFLAAAMLSYGFAKVFKTQFYLPEPNTLYTPLGHVPRDLLFWSTTGVSHSYSVFTGLVEVLVGFLLLFQRSRLAGGLLGLTVMANVLVLNLSYDISVKIYSSLLLCLCLVIVSPDLPRLWALLRGRSMPASTLWTPVFALRGQRLGFAALKTLVVCALIFDAVGQNFESGNFNDDLAPRPPYHGAYDVQLFVMNGDTLPPDLRLPHRWRRVFVHRQGYLIVQGMDDQMHDFPMEIDQAMGGMTVMDPIAKKEYWLWYGAEGDHLKRLYGELGSDTLSARLTPLDWRGLPLLRGEFNWTSDEM